MIDLMDKIWQQIDGGYRTAFDASVPLTLLEAAKDSETITDIWEQLWEELHHQGDVGLASYLALPQLVRIGTQKNLFDWNLLAICSTIEQQRHAGHNPQLPAEFQDYYLKGLSDLRAFAVSNLTKDLDKTTLIMALSAIATCGGQIKLGKAIMEMEDEDLLDEFLQQF